MNIAYFITKRIAFSRKKTFSRLIIRIAILAITLSMTVMIVSTAMVKGFQQEISEKVYGFMGHIQVSNFDRNYSYENTPIPKGQPFLDNIDTVKGVRHVQQYATKPGIININDQIEGIVLKGVSHDFDWKFLSDHLVGGHTLNLFPDSMSKGILLSRTTADRLNLSLNDKVFLDFVNPETFRVRSREFFVEGIYNTGMEEFDKLFALVDIKQIRRLNNWDSTQIGGFEIFVNDLEKLDQIDSKIYQMIGQDLNSFTIKHLKPNIFDWLNLQTINERVILILMIIVATINMITALLILILERTNMIGILKSLGGNNQMIRKIFLYNAMYIVIIGLVCGNLFGLGISFLQQEFELITLPEKTYYVSVAPIHVDFMLVLILNAGTFLVTMIALLLPSYLVSRIQPIKAIRFE